MLAIWKREVQNYFLTPIGYVFMGIFLLVGGIFFFLYNIMSASSDLSTMFGNLSYLFMLAVPILTMKLLSEEKRNKSDQLLLTSPRSIWDIVLGKFLAACTVLLATMAITLIYALIIAVYSNDMIYGRSVNAGLIFSNYLGFFLLGCGYVAIGTLMSALTENQVSAAVLTMGVNMLLQMVESILPQLTLPDALSFLTTGFSWLSMYTRFYEFSAGVLSIANVIYFVSLCGIILFLAVRVIDKRRWSEG